MRRVTASCLRAKNFASASADHGEAVFVRVAAPKLAVREEDLAHRALPNMRLAIALELPVQMFAIAALHQLADLNESACATWFR